MPDSNLQTEHNLQSFVENDKAKETWRKVLKKLAEISPVTIDVERVEKTQGIKLYRGTSICDVVYAILEKDGELISPLSYPDNKMEEDLGTIMTDEIAVSVSVANDQIEVQHLLKKKYKWMAETTGLSIDEVNKIGGLWQPIILELTNNIPELYVESHYGEIWSKKPVNILRGALSEKSMDQIFNITGINIKQLQLNPVDFQPDSVIEEMILQSEEMNQKLWEESILDEAITPDEQVETYWDQARENEIENQSAEYFSHEWQEWTDSE